MICDYCGTDTVTWKGPISALTHTQCERCGAVNCQRVDLVPEADPDIAAEALRKIAAGRFINAQGHPQMYSKEAMMQMAREACVALGLDFKPRER